MPRSVDDWGTVGATLARVLALPTPAWVHPATAAMVGAALGALRRDALAAVAEATTYAAPKILGVGRTSLMAARAPGGWLSSHGPGATLAEVWADATRSPPRPGSGATPKRAGGRRP